AVTDTTQLFRTDHTAAEILRLVSGRPLDFPPGEKWSYSNTGYYVLGLLIEKVSGKPYWEFLDERIFEPLGMTQTRSGDPKAVIPDRARGYAWEQDAYRNR